MKKKFLLKISILLFVLLISQSNIVLAAPVYIDSFADFPAYPYNIEAYKQDNRFVGCGPTTGAMIFAYFQHRFSLTDLLDNPIAGVNEGLETAWELHHNYMYTQADGFGSVYNIKPGLEGYAADRGHDVKVVAHADTAADPTTSWYNDYGDYGDAWLNDGIFWIDLGGDNWDIDPDLFCDFIQPKLAAGIAIMLTVDSDEYEGGDHWVPCVGFDKENELYYFYDTYTTSIQSATIAYAEATPVAGDYAITFVRSIEFMDTGFTEDFEGTFPGVWVVGDSNTNGDNGDDYWDDISYRSHTGSLSAWCADTGNKQVTIMEESVPSDTVSGWSRSDADAEDGDDYWDESSTRAYSGSYSFWCAGVGSDSNSPYWPNWFNEYYDDNMDARLSYYVGSLSSYSYVELSYYYWMDNADGSWDYLDVMYYSGGDWHFVDRKYSGSSDWVQSTVEIPNTATYVGFRFYSDSVTPSGGPWEGAYVDDIVLIGVVENADVHEYDDNMGSYMYRSVDLSGYTSATLSYWYWMDYSDGSYDYLEVMYFDEGVWHYVDRKNTGTSNWMQSTVEIPTSALFVGFKFTSDTTVHNYEGTYIDDVTLTVSSEPTGKDNYLVVRGANNRIYYRTLSGDVWGSWNVVPSGLTCDTPATTMVDGQLYMVVRGMDGASLWFGSIDLSINSFSGWSYLSGSTPSKPTLVCWENGQRLILIVRGDDNGIYHRHYDLVAESWFDWSTLIPGSTPDSPAAAVDGDYLHLVVRGMDDGLYYMKFSLNLPIMPGWTLIGGTTPSAPTLASNYRSEGDEHLLYLVVRGSDDGIYLRSYDGAWSSWNSLPGATNDAVGACIQPSKPDPDAALHIVVRGMTGGMYHGKYDLNTDSFLGWTLIGGETPSPPTLTS